MIEPGEQRYCRVIWEQRFNDASVTGYIAPDTLPDNIPAVYTVGPLGVIVIPLQHTAEVARRLRLWADLIEKNGAL